MKLSKVFPALLCILLIFSSCKKETVPIVKTLQPDEIGFESAIVGGEITDDGNSTVTDKGIYYSLTAKPETTGSKIEVNTEEMTFSYDLNGLEPETNYFIIAYATNNIGTSFGKEESFTTLSECEALSYGSVSVKNSTGYNIYVDITWGAYLLNDERLLADGENTIYDEVPAGSIKIWVLFDGTDWLYENETLSVCEDMTYTWYLSSKKALSKKHK